MIFIGRVHANLTVIKRLVAHLRLTHRHVSPRSSEWNTSPSRMVRGPAAPEAVRPHRRRRPGRGRRLHHRINHRRITSPATASPDAPQFESRQSLRKFPPVAPAIGSLINPAPGVSPLPPRIAARESIATHFVGSGVERIAIAWIHHQVDRAGIGVDRQTMRPRQSAVHRLKNAALLIGTPQMPQRRDVHHVRIPRIDTNSSDVLRIFETQVLPVLAAIGGFVNSIAPGNTGSRVGFSGAYPNRNPDSDGSAATAPIAPTGQVVGQMRALGFWCS